MDKLVIPVAPSVNHAYRNFDNGNRRMRVPTKKTEQFKQEAGWIAKAWRAHTSWVIPPEDQKIIVRMWVYWQNRSRRDADNLFKVTLDALTGILYLDDRMCLPRVMDFSVDRTNPRVELELEVMEVTG